MLKSGVPLLTAMDIVKNVITNTVLSGVIEKARDAIAKARASPRRSRDRANFRRSSTTWWRSASAAGQLEEMLLNVANAYERR